VPALAARLVRVTGPGRAVVARTRRDGSLGPGPALVGGPGRDPVRGRVNAGVDAPGSSGPVNAAGAVWELRRERLAVDVASGAGGLPGSCAAERGVVPGGGLK
jgi:hypothetical protein